MANPDYDNTNSGSLFRNYDKEKLKQERDTSKWANAQGKIDVYGVEFYISSWTKVIKSGDHKGDKMQSLSIKPVNEEEGHKLQKLIQSQLKGSAPQQQGNQSSQQQKKEDPGFPLDEDEDDLPF